MAATTKGGIDEFITSFETYLDAGNYDAARVALAKAQARLSVMPDTEQYEWNRFLDKAEVMLDKIQSRTQSAAGGSVVYSDFSSKIGR